MSTDIKIRKKVADGYETFYPTNNAQNVIRDTNNFNYIDGTTLLEAKKKKKNSEMMKNTLPPFLPSSVTNI